MSTNDVPGAVAGNNDTLAMGCWAEHQDKSLMFVESTEGGNVVYSMFDVSREPAIEFRDAMPEADFKKTFSWPNKLGEKWTWHDKTPFPWDQVMKDFPAGSRVASAGAMQTAARRAAEALGLRARTVDPSEVAHLRTQLRAAQAVVDGVQRALDRLPL